MKKIFFVTALLFSAAAVKATVHTITVQNFSFSPSSLSANCNDTIKWQWVSGTHTTTSVSVPAGAPGWGANISSATPTYTYQVTVAGTYSYICTPHVSMGMTGSISVTCPSGISVSEIAYFSAAYPNPFSSKLTIETSAADMISIYNFVGEKIKTILLQHGQTKAEVNTADLNNGVYFYCVLKEGIVIETKKIIKN